MSRLEEEERLNHVIKPWGSASGPTHYCGVCVCVCHYTFGSALSLKQFLSDSENSLKTVLMKKTGLLHTYTENVDNVQGCSMNHKTNPCLAALVSFCI